MAEMHHEHSDTPVLTSTDKAIFAFIPINEGVSQMLEVKFRFHNESFLKEPERRSTTVSTEKVAEKIGTTTP
jgi:hypothetical protein